MSEDLDEVPAPESANGVSNSVDPPLPLFPLPTTHRVQIIIGSVFLAYASSPSRYVPLREWLT